ncbi:MAG: tRNA (guanosine(37)-N1)-methyltransferase TrmD [Pseudomonadota bacterium]|nr:tRNA (guanosine(37)-N1)-methyltransferase TrmD [Pseudomonadota bacterium]
MNASPVFSAIVLTLFPEMFPGPLGHSLAGKALEKGLWSLEAMDIRDFAHDRYRTVDDRPYGGGTGMVMKPDVVDEAVEAAKRLLPEATVIYFSPRGTPITQKLAQDMVFSNGSPLSRGLILLCGRFEGVDQRVIEHHDMLEVSLGDFVLSGGEIAAMALLDACVRLLPGVTKEGAVREESFAPLSEYAGLLEYPHYTRPPLWKGRPVPEMLLSGNHEHIRRWRLEQARQLTAARRPDLMKKD